MRFVKHPVYPAGFVAEHTDYSDIIADMPPPGRIAAGAADAKPDKATKALELSKSIVTPAGNADIACAAKPSDCTVFRPASLDIDRALNLAFDAAIGFVVPAVLVLALPRALQKYWRWITS
jgi:hypothetical protein